jgi:hypothetical protein
MKTTLLAASSLIGLLTLGGVLLDHNPASAVLAQDSVDASSRGKADVVLILCGTNGPPPMNTSIIVTAFSGSIGAPTVQLGVECAQGLASVLSAGFQLRDVASGNVGGVLYTLSKR